MSNYVHQLALIGSFLVLVSAYFEIETRSIEQIGDTTYVDYSHLRIRRDHETKKRKIYGNITIHIDLDNSLTAEMLAFVKQGGEYRLMPYKLQPKGFCDFLNEDEYFYRELTENSDWPFPLPCPLTKRVIEFRGVIFSLGTVPLTILADGEYALELRYLRDDEPVFQFRTYLAVINF